MTFKELHHQDQPLLIANVWDVPSAKQAQKAGYRALGTSSAAIAAMLGYEDGEQMTFDELLYILSRIAEHISIPLTVDLESGYSRNPQQVADHIRQLAKYSVVGINIEDSLMKDQRKLIPIDFFSNFLKEIKQELIQDKVDMFINVRLHAFLLNVIDAKEEATKRIRAVEQAGADGIFLPCLTDEAIISELVNSTDLPVNIMCMPNLSNFKALKQLGVCRLSMGNFPQQRLAESYSNLLNEINVGQLF